MGVPARRRRSQLVAHKTHLCTVSAIWEEGEELYIATESQKSNCEQSTPVVRFCREPEPIGDIYMYTYKFT
jgi:hypothetical protein